MVRPHRPNPEHPNISAEAAGQQRRLNGPLRGDIRISRAARGRHCTETKLGGNCAAGGRDDSGALRSPRVDTRPAIIAEEGPHVPRNARARPSRAQAHAVRRDAPARQRDDREHPRSDGAALPHRCAVLEVFPVLPLIANEPLGVGAVSYAGSFNIAVVADRDAYPDLGVFVAGAREELDALRVSAHPIPALKEASA